MQHKTLLIYVSLSILFISNYAQGQITETGDNVNYNKSNQDTLDINRNQYDEEYYYPPLKHLLLELSGGTMAGLLGTIAVSEIIHPNENTNINGDMIKVSQPFDMPLIYGAISSITIYGIGRSLKTRGSLAWSTIAANVMPLGIMSYGYICGKPNDYRPAVYVSSLFAPLMATIAYNVTAVQQSKKDLKYSSVSAFNTSIAWKLNDKTKKMNPCIIIKYNF